MTDTNITTVAWSLIEEKTVDWVIGDETSDYWRDQDGNIVYDQDGNPVLSQ